MRLKHSADWPTIITFTTVNGDRDALGGDLWIAFQNSKNLAEFGDYCHNEVEYGSTKDCYFLRGVNGSGFAIKFSADDDALRAERNWYNYFSETLPMICPTLYIPIELIDGKEWMIIQPELTRIRDEDDEIALNRRHFNMFMPCIMNEIVQDQLWFLYKELMPMPLRFFMSMIDNYDQSAVEDLVNSYVDDLNIDNLGYFKEKPFIFDWWCGGGY